MNMYRSIGTVVRLYQAPEVLFMVVGILAENENGERRDYVALRYPVGALGDTVYFFFNEEEIQEVVHEGYVNEDHQAYNDLLRVVVEQNRVQ